jgi:hypothetical protein
MPDERGHIVVGRCREDVGRRVELLDLASPAQHCDAIAESHCLVEVMGDEDDRLTQSLLQTQKLGLQLLASDRVGRAEWLIHEHHRWVGSERPRHSHALLLASGELLGIAVCEFPWIELDCGEKLVDPVGRLLLGPAEQLRHDRDVLRDGHVREESDLLNDVTDVATKLVRIEGEHVAPVDRD